MALTQESVIGLALGIPTLLLAILALFLKHRTRLNKPASANNDNKNDAAAAGTSSSQSPV
ncbi:uncharacterized protein K452DRAFT_294929 [Aplosporella prunicola CBS 121167]|uniref:Uncharacterized protein n=1 Tax=Aplosporella prunicola CBS 121167 TaxID=1176127 RepID=A0A6A6BSZ4_9PEZI|nr:uncharacterized protein K452DRAFT_294929 [Aplosporella prunicola CBS 121167]KAF2146364.1 hypothetical protein K452DRAFT_294929 [Aplosporella prunicola CBS 121167]